MTNYPLLLPTPTTTLPIPKSDEPKSTKAVQRSTTMTPWGRLAVAFVVGTGVLYIVAAAIAPNAAMFFQNENQVQTNSSSSSRRQQQPQRRRLESGQERIKVFSIELDHPVARKQRKDIAALAIVLDHVVLNLDQQRAFVAAAAASKEQQQQQQQYLDCGGDAAITRFDDLVQAGHSHLATELWKYCALYRHGGLYLDSSSPLLESLDHWIVDTRTMNKAVLHHGDSFPRCLHGSFLYLSQPRTSICKNMLQLLLETPLNVLVTQPLVVPQTLYSTIQKELSYDIHPGPSNDPSSRWYFLELKCIVDSVRNQASTVAMSSNAEQRLHYQCPLESGYCCHIYDTAVPNVVMMTRYPLLPYQLLPSLDQLNKPFAPEHEYFQPDDLPYISTIRERVLSRPTRFPPTPNFFEILLQNDCLPSDQKCASCLRNKGRGANCQTCLEQCPCYCKTLCKVSVPPKWVSKEITVTPPTYSRDPSRLVPRIVHQTWFEPVEKEKYPNMSRLIESFRQSGWEYRFYTDDLAAKFLSTHFPPEVRQAYDALRPGAFKADLFRYCVLLIHGGVYADMDVMLESNLDVAVGPNVGFLVPVDEPGKPINLRMCLWNGFIAAAPGHPILAKVVEIVVNNVRNRFTSVDYDNMYCPNPELSVLHAFDTLFTAGPCILGSTVNQILGRSGQTQFEAGELFPLDRDIKLPGRTIILHQNKWDMGAHRFTLLEKNLVVAGTDFPEYDDRENEGVEHYSKTHVNTGIYGVDRLYIDSQRANEELRFYVGAHRTERIAQTS